MRKQKEFIDFAEWIFKNAKPVKKNEPFNWEVKIDKFKGHPITEYLTEQDLYDKYLETKQ